MKLVGKRKDVKAVDKEKLKKSLDDRNLTSASLSREMGYNAAYISQYLGALNALPMFVINYMDKVYNIHLDDIKPDPIPEPEPEPEPEKVEEVHTTPTDEWEKQVYRAVLNGCYKGMIKAVKQLKEDGIL